MSYLTEKSVDIILHVCCPGPPFLVVKEASEGERVSLILCVRLKNEVCGTRVYKGAQGMGMERPGGTIVVEYPFSP